MLRISSFLYSGLFFLALMFCQEILQLALPEAAATSMVVTIVVHILVSWKFLHYVYTGFYTSIDDSITANVVFNKILTLALFSLTAITLVVVTYFMTRAIADAPGIAIGACIALIFISNYRTTAWKLYSVKNARRQASGLKSV